MDFNCAALYSDLCRLCLENKGVNDLYQKMDLIQDIYLCTGVKVFLSHNWPRKICAKCLEIVVNAKQLRLLSTTNESRLRVLFEDEDDPALQIVEIHWDNEKDNAPSEIDANDPNASHTDEGEDDDRIIGKKNNIRRSRSSENEEPAKRIAVRKDLFNSSKPFPSPTKENTCAEGIKDVTPKRRSVSNDNGDGTLYACAYCPKTFPTWKKVYCHQRQHNKNIPCPIEACGKKFAAKGDLEKHIRTHTGERPFACNICDKRFSQRSTLRIHKEATHQKEYAQWNEDVLKKESVDQAET